MVNPTQACGKWSHPLASRRPYFPVKDQVPVQCRVDRLCSLRGPPTNHTIVSPTWMSRTGQHDTWPQHLLYYSPCKLINEHFLLCVGLLSVYGDICWRVALTWCLGEKKYWEPSSAQSQDLWSTHETIQPSISPWHVTIVQPTPRCTLQATEGWFVFKLFFHIFLFPILY